MWLKRRGFVGRDSIPRGISGSVVPVFGDLLPELKGTEAAANSVDQKKLRILERSVNKLFEDAKLDVHDLNDWKLIVYVLAIGMYSPKGAGRSRRWSKKITIQLKTEVDDMRATTNLTDLDCCKKLAPKYGVTSKTLLRRLYRVVDRKKASTDRGQFKAEVGAAETRKELGPNSGESVAAYIAIKYAMMQRADFRRLAA